MTNSAPAEPIKAYATLRVTGDRLDPEQVTRLLKIVPTLAYAKGELYSGGSRSPDLIGRTGVWYFCTDGIVAGTRLADHFAFLLRQVAAAPAFQQLLKRKALDVVVTAFWHGPAKAKQPPIPRALADRLKRIPARIEMDFDHDGADDRHAA
nr:DUF4279 domain-containing protein [uncultured Rhodopila sp.]